MSNLPPEQAPRRIAEFGWPSGDDPGEISFDFEIEPALREALLKALAGHIMVPAEVEIRALTPPIEGISRYSLTGEGLQWFLRASVQWGEPELEQAITGFLRDRDVAVNHLDYAGLAIDFAGRRSRLDVRQLVGGHHFSGSSAELESLAALLAQCHRELLEFPRAAEVRRLSAERFARLNRTRELVRNALAARDWAYFADDPDWGAQHADWLAEMVAGFDHRFDEKEGAQCLHAQVHRANVLYTPAPVLVDFEEAVQTFATPAWDLAYFIQRFCVHDEPTGEMLAARLALVRRAYPNWPAGIAEMMRQAAWLSMLVILGDRHEQQLFNPPSEYDKFVRLERQAQRLAPLLA